VGIPKNKILVEDGEKEGKKKKGKKKEKCLNTTFKSKIIKHRGNFFKNI